MGQYIKGWWGGLSKRGRAVVTVVVAVVLLAAFYLALVNTAAFSSVLDSIGKLRP